ncbi:hypothetical protein ACHAW6_007801 [Cyclotella cf. meneghiniana]
MEFGLPTSPPTGREAFIIKHRLNCKKGGLVSIHHDDACNELATLCSHTLSSSGVVIEPTIMYDKESPARLLSNAPPNSPLLPWKTKHKEMSLHMDAGNKPEAPASAYASVTQMSTTMATLPPTKTWPSSTDRPALHTANTPFCWCTPLTALHPWVLKMPSDPWCYSLSLNEIELCPTSSTLSISG